MHFGYGDGGFFRGPAGDPVKSTKGRTCSKTSEEACPRSLAMWWVPVVPHLEHASSEISAVTICGSCVLWAAS